MVAGLVMPNLLISAGRRVIAARPPSRGRSLWNRGVQCRTGLSETVRVAPIYSVCLNNVYCRGVSVSDMEAKNPVKSVETATGILDALKERGGATVTELSEALGVTKGTVHNHLSTLAAERYVVQRDGEYHLGTLFFEYGEHVKAQHAELFALAVPEVDKLAAETGELGNLFVEEHGQGIYLYRAAGDQALNLDTGVGASVDLHNTALGKAILAFTPAERVEAILDRHGMAETTESTITDRTELFEELERIRERGVALDLEERVVGVQCVAAPIQTKDGRVLGAISVAGPTSRLGLEERAADLVELVANTADVISINATYD